MINLLLFEYELFKGIITLGVAHIIVLVGFIAFDYIGGFLIDLYLGGDE